MKEGDFRRATSRDRETYIVRPYEEVPITVLVEGSGIDVDFVRRR